MDKGDRGLVKTRYWLYMPKGFEGVVTNYGKGGGGLKKRGGGRGHVKFYPYEKGGGGGAEKVLAMLKGGTKSFHSLKGGSRSFTILRQKVLDPRFSSFVAPTPRN